MRDVPCIGCRRRLRAEVARLTREHATEAMVRGTPETEELADVLNALGSAIQSAIERDAHAAVLGELARLRGELGGGGGGEAA